MTKSIIWSMVGPRLGSALGDHLGVEKAHHRRAGAQRGQLQVRRLELAGGHALRDHLADDSGNAFHVVDADVPVLLHRDLDHLVQLIVADIALGVHAMDGGEQLTEARQHRTGPRHDPLRFQLDLAHQRAGHRLMNRLLRFEETIDVGGAHLELLGDVADRGLEIADLAEQPLSHLENTIPGVAFDMFRNQCHLSGLVNQQFIFTYSAASASGIACWSSLPCCGAAGCSGVPASSRLLRNQRA
ncbi:hypothetical protein ACVWZW_004352 [Bradyrhizobium sp. F1.13.4]